jgi:glucan phosphoethanolaminetransferase (alkaline phosphatase superfamily)
MFMLMMPIAGIGFLMKYVLMSGFERNVTYGRNVNLAFWGKTNHEWGTIHLVLSTILIVLLVLHIVLHWKMIVSIFKRMIPNKTIQITFAIIISIVGFFSISFPLFIDPEIIQKNEFKQSHQSNEGYQNVKKFQKNDVPFNRKRNLNRQ